MFLQGKKIEKEISPVKRVFLQIAGFFFVGLAFIGIFVPLLPTTPFLLLAAACFVRSSDKFYMWLISNRIFGKYIKDYREKRGVTIGSKITSISIMWLTMLSTAIFFTEYWIVRIILITIATGVSIHLIRMKTVK